jgi:hypothetical protein
VTVREEEAEVEREIEAENDAAMVCDRMVLPLNSVDFYPVIQ